MDALSSSRPCFHSEADFQFALGWQIKTLNPTADVRLELPVRCGSRKYKLDLLYRLDGVQTAVELKFFKAPFVLQLHGEQFDLTDAVAHDINRYDYFKDIQRLEHILAAGQADEAYAVVLTNQPKYWSTRNAGNRVDEAFGLEEGRRASGQLAWAAHVGGTSKGRENPICLAGSYEFKWADYARTPEERFGDFRYLSVAVASGELPQETAPLRKAPAPQQTSRRPKYEALKDHLMARGGAEATMTFAELEAITGTLPASARNHRVWWGNHAGNSQAAWLRAGWKVDILDMSQEVVVFRRTGASVTR